MNHPEDTCYHFVLADGIQKILDSIPGKPFGIQSHVDQSGTYIVIDCRSTDRIGSYSELKGSIIKSPPTFITDIAGPNPENTSWANARTIIKIIGSSGKAWKAVDK